LLRNALRELPDVIGHVHDEIVMEVPADLADEAAGVLRSVMVDVPDWADGFPLDADPSIMFRYGK
jgi:DNA polymerase